MIGSVGRGLASGIVIITVAGGVYGQAPPTYTIADQADAIIVGEVQTGRQIGYSLTLVLTVARSIKGDLVPGAVANVSGSCAPRANNKDLTKSYGMFFLRKTGGSQWTLQPVMKGMGFETTYFALSKVTSPANIPTRSPAATLSDRIAVELATGLQAHASPLQLYHLETALLGMPDSAVTQDLFQSIRRSSDPELRLLALAKMLRTGDDSALAEVADNLDLLPQLTATHFVIPAIHAQAYFGPAVVGPLGRIAKSSDVYVQRGAADALMSIHTRETLPFLAELLDSKDPTNRELAMRGLSRFVENLPSITQHNVLNGKSLQPQGPAPYRTAQTDRYSLSTRRLSGATETEAAFLQFWKSWWATMKDQLAPKGQ